MFSSASPRAAQRPDAQNRLGIAIGLLHKGPRRAKGAHRRRATPGGPAPLRSLIKLVRLLFVCTVLAAIGGGVFVGVTIWHFGRDLPDYQQLAHYEPPILNRVPARAGRLLAQ